MRSTFGASGRPHGAVLRLQPLPVDRIDHDRLVPPAPKTEFVTRHP